MLWQVLKQPGRVHPIMYYQQLLALARWVILIFFYIEPKPDGYAFMPESLQITEFNLKRLHAKTKTLLYIEVFSFLLQTPLIILLSFCYIKQVEARERIRTSDVQYFNWLDQFIMLHASLHFFYFCLCAREDLNSTSSVPQLVKLFCFAHNLAQSGFKSSRE